MCKPKKSCPFCGEMPVINKMAHHMFYIACKNDECECNPVGSAYHTVREASLAWDCRASEKALADLIAADAEYI